MVFSERRIICDRAELDRTMLQASVSCQRAQAININQQLLFSVIIIMVSARSAKICTQGRIYNFLLEIFLR